MKAVLESAEQALAMENADERQELTSEEMARRAGRARKSVLTPATAASRTTPSWTVRESLHM